MMSRMYKYVVAYAMIGCLMNPMGLYAQHENTVTANAVQSKKYQVTISGTVVERKSQEPIPYAQVLVKGTTLGVASDAHGNYVIADIPLKQFTLVVRSIGYGTQEIHVHSSGGNKQHFDIYLDEEAIALDGVVVSSNKSETLRRMAPSLVTVLTSELFAKTASSTLSQGLRFQPGLRVEDNCQNCGFNQVRINGLEGAYSQILIDGRPVFSALAGVYGLEQISANMIERVEVVRGGGSALFGSGAIGGVVNIITREPVRNNAEVSHMSVMLGKNNGGFSSVENVTSFNASMLTENRKGGIMVFGRHNIRPGHDFDGDSFTELPALKGRSLGFRSYYKTGLYSMITAEFRSMQESRRGGDRLALPPFQARIAEALEHHINGGSLRYDQSWAEGQNKLSLYASAQHVRRGSYYGGGDLTDQMLDGITSAQSAEERQKAIDDMRRALSSYGITTNLTAQIGGMYAHTFGKHWLLTVGLENTSDLLKDQSDYRPVSIDQKSIVFGQYDQIEYKTDRFAVLVGGRFDLTNLYQADVRQIDPLLIFSPRANVRYNPISDMTMRLSYSEGFRAPQFFDEEMHVELLGGTQVVRELAKNLREERSRSVSGSVDYYATAGDFQYNLMLEGFATFITNKFETTPVNQKDTEGRYIVQVQNQPDGVSRVFGANMEARLAYRRLADLQLGLTYQRSLYGTEHTLIKADEETGQKAYVTKEYERTPDLYGYFVATIRPDHHWTFNLSGTLTGAMNVPHLGYEGIIASANGQSVTIGGQIVGALNNGQFDFVYEGQRYRGLPQGMGRVERSSAFFDMDFKAAYEFDLTNTLKLEINGGIQNIFGSYQKNGDMGPGRASDYVYGPMLPRRLFAGVSVKF